MTLSLLVGGVGFAVGVIATLACQYFRTRLRRQRQWPGVGKLTSASGAQFETGGLDELRLLREDNTARLLRESEALSATRARLIAHISHEVRTPLNAILGFSQLLVDPRLTEKQRSEAVRSISESGRYMLALVDEVLDFSQVESGHLELHLQAIDVPALLREVVDQLPDDPTYPPEVLTTLHIDPVHVQADALRLRQILINLLTNARKYNWPFGWVRVQAGLRGGWVRISVTNSGDPIPANIRPLVFNPFERARSVAGRVRGSGLGLAIARELAQAMGGRLTVDVDTAGASNTFTLELPAAPSQHPGHEAVQRVPEPLLEQADYDLCGRLVCFEDDSASQALLRAWLGSSPMLSLSLFESAEDVVGIVERLRPNVVLMDVNLPGIDGIDATRILRDHMGATTPPVVALTARTDVLRVAHPFSAVLLKPLERKQLEAVLQRWLAHSAD